MKKIVILLLVVFTASFAFAQKDSTRKDSVNINVNVSYATTPQETLNYQLSPMQPEMYTTQQVPESVTHSSFSKLKDGLRMRVLLGESPTDVIKTKTEVVLVFWKTKVILSKDEYIDYLESVILYRELHQELLELLHRVQRQLTTPPPPPFYNGGYYYPRPTNGGW